MTILSILPLLIFILGLLVISKVNVFFSKRTNSVVIVYVFILLTATVVYSLLPMEKQAETNEVEKEFLLEMEDFKETFQEGSLEQLKKNYTYEEWTLTTDKKELFLEGSYTPALLTKVVNEQTENNQIKVYLFHTDMLYNGKIISGKLGNYTAEINDGYLLIYSYMEETIQSSVFMEEFPIKQFSSRGDGGGYTIDGRYLGLYIVAPTDVKISE